MSYTISYTDKNKTPIVVNDDTVDSSSVDISLFGRSELMYGQELQENLLHLLENFALPADESGINPDTTQSIDGLLQAPVNGQIWYNKTNSRLYGYNGTTWQPLSRSDDLAANWGVIQDGNQIPLPIAPSGKTFNYSECIWVVSPFSLPQEIDSLICQTDDQANVTMQFNYVSDNSTQTGYANYLIIGIRNNINFVPPPVTVTPSPTLTQTPSRTIGSSPTPTPSATRSPTPTPSLSPTKSPRASPPPTVTPSRTAYSSPTPTPSHSPTTSPPPYISSVALDDTCVNGSCSNYHSPTTPASCTATAISITTGTTATGVITGGDGNFTFGYTYQSGSTSTYTLQVTDVQRTLDNPNKFTFKYTLSNTQNSTQTGGPPCSGCTTCSGAALPSDQVGVSGGGTVSNIKIWAKDSRGHIAYSSTLKVVLQYWNTYNGSGGGGGGGCADITSYTPMQSKLIGDYELDHEITACRHTDLAVVTRSVSRAYHSLQPCFRLHMECGATVVVSSSTPLEGKDARFYPSEAVNQELPVMNAASKEVKWNKVKDIEYVGERTVNRISLNGEDLNYFAGETPEWFVSVHNTSANPVKPTLFGSTIKKV